MDVSGQEENALGPAIFAEAVSGLRSISPNLSHLSDCGPEVPPLERGGLWKISDCGHIVNVCQVIKPAWGGQRSMGNFGPLYSKSNYGRRDAVCLPALSSLHTAPIELYST
jgi:hypothetical protein